MKDKYKTVIITGAGGLLGKAFVGTLLKKNLNVMAIDNNLSSLKSLSRNHENRNLNFMKVNLLNENEINNAKNKTLKNFGTIDYLINCAALDAKVNKKKLILDKFENFKISRWQKELDLNLKITFLSCKIFGSHMAKKKFGGIVNLGSDLTVISPNQKIYNNKYIKPITYSVAKFGVLGMTKYLSSYWAKKNVRVNCLSPGPVNHKQPKFLKKNILEITPQKKILNKNDLSDIVAFLCSEKSTYITGQNFLVDGGRTIV